MSFIMFVASDVCCICCLWRLSETISLDQWTCPSKFWAALRSGACWRMGPTCPWSPRIPWSTPPVCGRTRSTPKMSSSYWTCSLWVRCVNSGVVQFSYSIISTFFLLPKWTFEHEKQRQKWFTVIKNIGHWSKSYTVNLVAPFLTFRFTRSF